jgi:hypothetical protein
MTRQILSVSRPKVRGALDADIGELNHQIGEFFVVRWSEEARDCTRCFAHNALPMRWAAAGPWR